MKWLHLNIENLDYGGCRDLEDEIVMVSTVVEVTGRKDNVCLELE